MTTRLSHQEKLMVLIQFFVFVISMGCDAHGYETAVIGNAMFAPPTALARTAKSVKDWMIMVAIHFMACATGLYMRGDMHGHLGQMLIVLGILDIVLVDVAKAKISTEQTQDSLQKAFHRFREVSTNTVSQLFADFCDAEVEVDLEGTICKPSYRLEGLLCMSKNATVGKKMSSFVNPEDLAAFEQYFRGVLSAKQTDRPSTSTHTFSLRLQDSVRQNVAVHLVHSHLPFWKGGGESLIFGIMEATPAKKRQKPETAQRQRQEHTPFSSNTSVPSVPPRRPRADSPRPNHARAASELSQPLIVANDAPSDSTV